LCAEQERLNNEFAETPQGRVWAANEELSDEHIAAEVYLFETTATTLEGLLALLTYTRTDDYLSETMNDRGSDLAALFERSLCKIADLPEPPPWFDSEETEEA
jgi:hypothetical protein